MSVLRHIPNLITSCNLACGVLGIILALEGELVLGAYMIFAGALFDFFDGFAARMLKVHSEIGKQLDSLADMVTFGVLPGILVYTVVDLRLEALALNDLQWLKYVAFIIPVLSAIRLAKFNLDTRQSEGFIGLPTPANAIFWSGFFLSFAGAPPEQIPAWLVHPYLILCIAVVFSLLLVAEIPMFSLKFKSFGFNENRIRFIFLGICALMIVGGLLIKMPFISVPIIILLYILIANVNNAFRKQ